MVVRADGGPGIGSGHLGRCLALTQAWIDGGGTAILASAGIPPTWAHRYAREGVDLREPADAPYAGADWAVMDGYGFSASDQEEIVASGCRLLSIDDHGRLGRNVADVILDQNLGATAELYPSRPDHTDLLLGPRYALLRRDFRGRHRRPRTTPVQARRLLVFPGGAPSTATVQTFAAVVADRRLAGMDVVELGGVDDVAAVMADADLAFATSGSVCWELCCTGLPAVLLAVADNQVPVARALSEQGAAEDAGSLDSCDPSVVAARLADLAADPGRRAAMSRCGEALVDGRGAKRVVVRLRSGLLQLRSATADDARVLWDWANDPVVRASAFHGRPIPWDDHRDWLARRLADPDTSIYVALDLDAAPVGVVRFQRLGSSAEISVTVAADRRGQGWGPVIIDGGVRQLLAETSVDEVIARIKPDNRASLSSFEDAAFMRTGESDGPGERCVHYIRYRTGRERNERGRSIDA